ncbi:MAG: outer membrane beta-barrel protein, partial [Vicinamibacterales bacterium]
LGHQRFRPRAAALPPFEGLVGSVDVAYRVRGTTTFRAAFDRDLAYSYAALEPYYIREGYGVSLRRQILPRLDVSAGGGRYWFRYRQLATTAGSETVRGRSDRLLNATLSLGFQVRRNTRLTTGVSYRDRRSDLVRRTYHSFSLGTSVVYGF